MSSDADGESEARRRLQSEQEARDEKVTRPRQAAEDDARTIAALRASHGQDAAKIHNARRRPSRRTGSSARTGR
jgi:hypothetical protein